MAADSPQPAAPVQDLRRGLAIRLGVAAVLLVGVTVAWQVLDRTAPRTENPDSGPAQQVLGRPVDQLTNAAARSQPNAATVQPQNSGVAEAQVEPRAAAKQTKVAAVPQESAPPGGSTADPSTGGHPVGEKNTQCDVMAPAGSESAAPIPRLPSGPYLQIGVFTHPANAAKLRAKLEAQGIPVYFATRVQVGPFKNKKEAKLMREKLKAMGITSLQIRQ